MAKNTISPARKGALLVLENVLTRGETLLETLPLLDTQCPDPRDLALAREIAIGTCRWLGRIRYILENLATRLDKFPHPIQRILEMSAYQLLYLDKVPSYATISEAVNLARFRQLHALTGPVNGILRTISRDPHAFGAPSKDTHFISHTAIEHSHPEWLIRKWVEIWGESSTEQLCRYNNTRAPLSLRIRGDESLAADYLQSRGIVYRRDERFASRWVIDTDTPLRQDWIEEGPWVVQDGAAMLVSLAVDAKPGERIWDVCAAPGGKTFFMADRMGDEGFLLATDKSEIRLQRLIDQQNRMNLSCITPAVHDVLNPSGSLDLAPFDVILVDAPCSGWGTFRRHPDLRWRLSPEDSPRLADSALNLLEKVSVHLKTGGRFVYSTCTLSPDENENVVQRFLERHPEFALESIQDSIPGEFHKAVTPAGMLSLFPPTWNVDGAFAARLRKQP